MLDYFAIFTRGGALLWTLQFTSALRHSPIEALNALIRTCLLEERSNDNTFTYVPKTGAHQALKWTFHNGLGLVFVAVYQKSLSLLYVEELLGQVRDKFAALYKPSVTDYTAFNDAFEKMWKECEKKADLAKRGAPLSKKPPAASGGKPGSAAKGMPPGARPGARGAVAGAKAASSDGADGDAEDSGEDGAQAAVAGQAHGRSDDGSDEGVNGESDEGGAGQAFDRSKLKGAGPRGARGRPAPSIKKPASKSEEKKQTGGKTMRTWGIGKGSAGSKPERLDYSEAAEEQGTTTDGTAAGTDRQHTDFEPSESERSTAGHGVSKVDEPDDTEYEGWTEDEEERAAAAAAKGAKPSGLLGAFLGRLKLGVMGSGALSGEDLAPALADMKKRLMERNVAEEIAANVCASVGKSLEGQKLASFTGVGAMVRRSFEEALSGILYKRQVDVLLDIRKAQERGKPYVIVFCGVNGVGKSTNLAKIAYWLGQHGVKVTIAACDTFRAGAVEQLKTHCRRLNVPLYERGYEKDPAKVAAEAVKQAERDGRHVVLVDTAGRMQDNEPLMRALSNLIAVNNPQLVLFVGEALVGNDAVDQLTKFSRALQDLAPPVAGMGGSARRRGIDGIVLTKFDTIDDKVGAALSMVYSSGAPIMFVGCGQTYVDLKKLNVKSVVNSLLK